MTEEDVKEEIAQYAAILASMISPSEAANFLDVLGAELRRLQPVDN